MRRFIQLAILTLCVVIPGHALAVEGTVPSADGVSIHYITEGSGAPALVFVHCWSCDTTVWDAQMKHFAPAHQVVAIDLAGHGSSGRGRKEWTIPAFGQDVRAVVEKLGLKKAILVGHSMGGSVIVEAARLMPERVILLVPVDSLQDVERKFTPEQIESFLAPFKQDFKKNTDAFMRGFFPEGTDPALVDRVAGKAASAPPEIAIAALASLFAHDLPGAMDGVKIPFHAINSDRRPTNLEGNRRHARFEVTLIPGVGHFPMLEKPAEFNQALAAIAGKATIPPSSP
ncbi:MAG TPA: alpha/beta hydrolase [Candidatus Polarisedimenticolia bacterium]|jgi:pimeloyl-ACP methyl ester carboxylesterase